MKRMGKQRRDAGKMPNKVNQSINQSINQSTDQGRCVLAPRQSMGNGLSTRTLSRVNSVLGQRLVSTDFVVDEFRCAFISTARGAYRQFEGICNVLPPRRNRERMLASSARGAGVLPAWLCYSPLAASAISGTFSTIQCHLTHTVFIFDRNANTRPSAVRTLESPLGATRDRASDHAGTEATR